MEYENRVLTTSLAPPLQRSLVPGRSREAWRWIVSGPRAHPYTTIILVVGLALRAALTPIAYGEDFRVWELAARYTLAGVNIYRDHPPYPGGPYAYSPLFLYIELPFRWLALRTGLSFTVLGKLPILAGDLLVAALIARNLARRGRRDSTVALGAALYFLNPLVLYNGAFSGRFDTLCVGLLLLALAFHHHEGDPFSLGALGRIAYAWAFPILYALAVAMKSYPIFLLPWLLTREPRGRKRLSIALVAVLGGLSLPYLLTSPARFVADILLYDAHKTPGHLSWQVILLGVLSPHAARLVSYLLLATFVVGLYHYRRLDLWTYRAVAILLFILLSKVVIEQYFLWPLPFLILDALERRSRASWGLLLLLTASGMLVNAHIRLFGESPWPIALALAAGIVAYLVSVTRRGRHGAVTV